MFDYLIEKMVSEIVTEFFVMWIQKYSGIIVWEETISLHFLSVTIKAKLFGFK